MADLQGELLGKVELLDRIFQRMEALEAQLCDLSATHKAASGPGSNSQNSRLWWSVGR